MRIEDRIQRCVPVCERELTPYHIEQADGLVKLDAMENPYPLPPALREEWNDLLAKTELNRYPDPHARALKSAWQSALGLGDEIAILLGNGSDELIHLLLLALAGGANARVLCPEPSFAVYRIATQSLGMDYIGVPLQAQEFALDLPAMLAAIERHQPGLVFLASPNNPTANRLDVGALAELCAATPGLVVLDEAYYRFAGATRVHEIPAFENLVVMHTLSKIGLAGLRVGALFGPRGWIELLERLRMPYNINVLSQVGATFALTHSAAFETQLARIVEARADLYAGIAAVPGVRVWPSATNFILLRAPEAQGARVFAALRAQGILVKNVASAHPLLTDCLRVTVGTPQENARFLAGLIRALA